MAEWFKVLVLKTNVFNKYRGFKSHFILRFLNIFMKPLPQKNSSSSLQIKLQSVYNKPLILYLRFLTFFLNKLFIKISIFNLPKKRKRITLFKSPHVNKTAKEQFEVFYYQAVITIKEPVSLQKLQYLFLNKPKSIKLKIKV
jgi:ribosomal protein S10